MRVREVIAYIFGKRPLVLQSQPFFTVLAAFLQVHACLGTDIRQLVFPFIRFDIGIHASQLLLNNDQTFIDEIGCIHRYLVLVVYRILIVNSDQHIQDILRTRDRHILQGQVNDRSRFTG